MAKLDIIKENVDNIDLFGFGDLHFGDKACNINNVKKTIKKIKTNDNARVILMGDILNCATKISIGAAVYDEQIHGQEQYDDALHFLEPIADKIYGGVIGNHEIRIINQTGYNPMQTLCKDLNCKYYGYSQFTKLFVSDVSYDIYSTHGSSGAHQIGTQLKKVMDLATFNRADIFMMGHVHKLAYTTQDVEYIRYNYIDKQIQTFVLTGHYLNHENSYADFKNMKPSPQGTPILHLDGHTKKVDVELMRYE